MTAHKGLPVLLCTNAAAWDAWLAREGATSRGVWLKLAKQGRDAASVGKADAIESALAHGWIDGQLAPWDEDYWLVRFTPRGPRSRWSQINRETATRLIETGRMTAAGRAQVERAKADGRWDAAYAPQAKSEVPPDLAEALAANPPAKAFFETLKGANRYAVLYRIHDARTAVTRAKRIEKFVAMLARGEVIHPAKRSASSSEMS